MSRYSEICIMNEAGLERAGYKLPYGARLVVDDGVSVKPGDKLADWDPYTLPVMSEISGTVHYVDLVEGVSLREAVDEATGLTKRVVADWKQSSRGSDLKPRLVLRDKEGKPLLFANGAEARYFLSVDAVLVVDNNTEVHAGDVLTRVPRESTKTRDITGGLPRVAELFEARRPKDAAIISEYDGRIEFGKDHKTKRYLMVVPEDENTPPQEYVIPKGKHIAVHEGEQVKRGDIIMDGNMVPHDILRILGIEALASYLINEIQEVYRLQGVPINDKHIEVIVRQMMQKIEITDPGETTFLLGEQVDKQEFEDANQQAIAEGRRPARCHAVLQGITKASLQTRSFFSAASFQETTRVLTEAAVSGKVDTLKGLKENIIVGRLIPVGTGSVVNRLKHIAAGRDEEVLTSKALKIAAALAHQQQDEQIMQE